MNYIIAFAVGGAICAVGQILIDKTKLTPARIMVGYVVAGCILSYLGIYGNFVDFAGAGATVPLLGFGNILASGTVKAISEKGAVGIFTGGLSACAAGLGAAIVFGYLNALIFRARGK